MWLTRPNTSSVTTTNLETRWSKEWVNPFLRDVLSSDTEDSRPDATEVVWLEVKFFVQEGGTGSQSHPSLDGW